MDKIIEAEKVGYIYQSKSQKTKALTEKSTFLSLLKGALEVVRG